MVQYLHPKSQLSTLPFSKLWPSQQLVASILVQSIGRKTLHTKTFGRTPLHLDCNNPVIHTHISGRDVRGLSAKKTNKHKTHKHSSDGPCRTIVPGTNWDPSQGQTGQRDDFAVELNRKRPVCPTNCSRFVPGRHPVCPREGACLSRTLSRPKRLCLLVFLLP